MLVISISFECVYFFLVPSRRYVGDQECLLFDERFLQWANLMVIYSIKICFIANSHLEMVTILLPNKSAVTRIKKPNRQLLDIFRFFSSCPISFNFLVRFLLCVDFVFLRFVSGLGWFNQTNLLMLNHIFQHMRKRQVSATLLLLRCDVDFSFGTSLSSSFIASKMWFFSPDLMLHTQFDVETLLWRSIAELYLFQVKQNV